LIGTYPILQAGLNIPSLQHVFFAAPSKSKIRVLQSIGRALRLYDRKDTAHIYDFIDVLDGKYWFENQSKVRQKHYENDSFILEQEIYYEKDFRF
jgi:superfamily II DNA or RNA helicase